MFGLTMIKDYLEEILKGEKTIDVRYEIVFYYQLSLF